MSRLYEHWRTPARLHLQLSHGAILGTAVRAKTTNRSMPFGFLVVGLSGSPSANWGVRFFNLLRQALADTLSLQPGRVVDFLPARLGGSDSRPLLLDPCERHLAVPRLLSLLAAHWSSNCTSQPPSQFALYGAHSCKATVLSWSRQMSLDRTLRRIQGHHRLSGADRSVELYGRDDIRPMLDLQAQVINHARAGFRPLQPLARGSSVPLPDFAVQLPTAPVPVLSEANVGPAHLPPAFPPCPGPLQEYDPSPVFHPCLRWRMRTRPLWTAPLQPVPVPLTRVKPWVLRMTHLFRSPGPLLLMPPSRRRRVRTWKHRPCTCMSTITGLMLSTLPGPPRPQIRPECRTHLMRISSIALPAVPVPVAMARRLSVARFPQPLLRVCTAPVVQLCHHKGFLYP